MNMLVSFLEKLSWACISLLTMVGICSAQAVSAKAGGEFLHMIRKERFDLLPPGAMRDHDVDMWIHVIGRGNPDAMDLDFGGVTGYIIFTHRGGNRVERALLRDCNKPPLQVQEGPDRPDNPGQDQSDPRWLTHYGGGPADHYDIFGLPDDLVAFVTEPVPQMIAANTSAWLAVADGISYSDYLQRQKALGPEDAKRIVSAEYVIAAFKPGRVQREVITFANAAELQSQIPEGA